MSTEHDYRRKYYVRDGSQVSGFVFWYAHDHQSLTQDLRKAGVFSHGEVRGILPTDRAYPVDEVIRLVVHSVAARDLESREDTTVA